MTKKLTSDPLFLYREMFPSLARAKLDDDNWRSSEAQVLTEMLSDARVFDCRQMPFDLIIGTGEAQHEQQRALKEPVRLPFPICYFEWRRPTNVVTDAGKFESAITFVCYAEELAIWERDDGDIEEFKVDFDGKGVGLTRRLGNVVELRGWMYEPMVSGPAIKDKGGFEVVESWPPHARYLNGIAADQFESASFHTTYVPLDDEFFAFYDIDVAFPPPGHGPGEPRPGASVETKKARETVLWYLGFLLLGTLDLLNEKLIFETRIPDPVERLSASRRKRGVYPLSGPSSVLRVDVPAVHRIAQRPVGSHESPMLHWRRGHDRVLHRGSEFESKTWVRKCLVGDPAKGFLRKDYRLVYEIGRQSRLAELTPPEPPMGAMP